MYSLIMKLIEKGKTDGLVEKANKLYLFGQLTDEEYTDIMERLSVINEA